MEKNFDASILRSKCVDPSFEEDILAQVLRIAVYNTYKAYNTYTHVIQHFGEVTPFKDLIQAEIAHYNALTPLLEMYSITLPVDDYQTEIDIPSSFVECCELAVASEIANIQMYNHLLSFSGEYPELTDTLFQLQAASYNTHLPLLRKCVQEHGITEGMQTQGMLQDFSEIAKKISSGEMSQEEIMKLLSNANMSFVGGLMLGGVSAGALHSMMKNIDTEEGE